MNFLMHKKDFRIMGANSEGMKNEDYILITDEEVKRLMADKRYGMMIIADRNKKKQDAEYAELKAQFGEYKEVPSSVEINAKGVDMPMEMPNLKNGLSDDAPEFYEKTTEVSNNSNFVDFSTMKVAELRKHAEARGIVDFENKSKAELLEELTR